MGQQQGRIQGVVELGQTQPGVVFIVTVGCARRVGEGGHGASGVEHDDQVLTAFGLELVYHGLAATRGRFPIDVAELVVGQVFAHSFELGAGAGDAHRAPNRLCFQAPPNQQVVASKLAQVGIDAHRFGGANLFERPSGPSIRR